MIVFAGGIKGFDDLFVSGGIELQKLLIFGDNAEAARGTFKRAVSGMGIGVGSHFLRAVNVYYCDVIVGCGGSKCGNGAQPQQNASVAELGQLLEEAVLGLPEQYRVVVMLRDIEELNTAETASALDLSEENVKVRLHRGRAMMRRWLFGRVGEGGKKAFPFMGACCDRVVLEVFKRLAESGSGDPKNIVN